MPVPVPVPLPATGPVLVPGKLSLNETEAVSDDSGGGDCKDDDDNDDDDCLSADLREACAGWNSSSL